ncbi:xanthine dehydrogenase family protein molybdopterin-binding subunit [Micromonospora krabiensis]|uniref:Xanthine dehydrogenase YagR molybdenum-binding subunit n=1 Tax=Micromonospora krabiensis TaxID=307121 RepID=A0A1C3NDW8_9ACTN|nr:xanthine dehydrogenase family protein molybdopterin-binding subunit [Micromonospora krabiensis]SBV30739.1 xanthine dehydrogenase YagR molybdenum-binding subunit [Micromonospora krabiensis]
MSPAIGATLNRVDGRPKVRGEARYSAEVPVPGLTHAVLVNAKVANARITAIDTSEAERAAGVLAVLTHRNLGRVATVPRMLPSLAGLAAPGQTFFPMQDETVHYGGQPVAIVVADTIERADHAGTLIRFEYETSPATTLLDQARDQAYVPERIFGGLLPGHTARGDVAKALGEADVSVTATFRFSANHHNPLEPSASTAVWEAPDRLTVYDSTQGPNAVQLTLAELLGLPPISIRVVSHAVGGSFGSKAMVWHHPALAALAARHVGRPVRLVLTREQMFTSCGHREEQEQQITLGARADGRITALRHDKLSLTSPFDDWAEPSLQSPSVAYTSPNYEGTYRLVRGNTITPTFMRAPGEATGMVALECAMDELAERVGVDPLELRLRNYSETDPESGQPWSSSGLRECYQRAAELFGWRDRDPRPRARRDGQWLIGSGMASALYPVTQPVNPQRARARLYNDGTAVVEAGVSEFGTGVYTAMTQVAADALGLPVERVRFVGGSSDLPNITAAVGSAGTSAVGSAVHLAACELRDQLIRRTVGDDHSPLRGADPARVEVRDGRMVLRDRPDVGETYADLLHRTMTPDVEVLGTWNPPPQDAGYGVHTFGAQMAEVAVDADLGVVRVRRMVGVFAPGRVLNRKTAHSQLMGGMLWGLSQALLEVTRMDPRLGRWANASLGDYLVPVNADAPDVVVDTVEVRDDVVNPIGIKGVGEIGVVGAAAAIANAVHHATGRRQYELPITLEKLL